MWWRTGWCSLKTISNYCIHKTKTKVGTFHRTPILKKAVGRFHFFINSFMQEQFSYNVQDSRDEDVCGPCEQLIFLCVAFFFPMRCNIKFSNSLLSKNVRKPYLYHELGREKRVEGKLD